MKKRLKKIITLFITWLILLSGSPSFAHGGGLDSRGGHNCRVGSCAGTYHCHQPRSDFCKRELGYLVPTSKKIRK